MSRSVPWHLNHEAIPIVTACLKADGHPLVSELIAEWMWRADDRRQAEIERIINGAVWTTIHLWA